MPASRLGLRAAGLLLGLLLLTHLSATGAGAEKPGVCPQLQNNTACVKECSSDNHCLDNLKCCQAGCSSVCSRPKGLKEEELPDTILSADHQDTVLSADHQDTILSAHHTPSSEGGQASTTPPTVVREEGDLEKQGACPSVDFPKLGICEDQCQVDSQCSGNMKCCRNGCGKMTCATPKF
ncbi:WAP four-disulfide core domain protein 2 [Phodopus roborovskii]|uniref:WAP four-disulfide core domain protein 2 n=1 Tax=Phodopus roborovskii TaxID=109678 RepID=A0AAU9YQ45_PHORO|nr:WAP four-disulfide core domain protein 2 [Phodopus roborovskii]CAH6776818.1 Wfdc2 [Phodopus roborovskii]